MRGFLVTGTDTDVGKTWFMLKFGALLERENQDYSQCWVSGFSFGSLICMLLIILR